MRAEAFEEPLVCVEPRQVVAISIGRQVLEERQQIGDLAFATLGWAVAERNREVLLASGREAKERTIERLQPKIAMLGIPSGEMSIDWKRVIFNMLTIKGIYGREMYETWYKMTVMLESGLDIKPVITHRFSWRGSPETSSA